MFFRPSRHTGLLTPLLHHQQRYTCGNDTLRLVSQRYYTRDDNRRDVLRIIYGVSLPHSPLPPTLRLLVTTLSAV